jgi:hypothetical protein
LVAIHVGCRYNRPPVNSVEDHDQDQMLADAIVKARKLVGELERQQKEIEASPHDLPPEQFAQGRQVFDNAVASARRMLKALEDAAALPAD